MMQHTIKKCLFILLLLCPAADAKRHSRRQGGITQALLGSTNDAPLFQASAPVMQVALADNLSEKFEEKRITTIKDINDLNIPQPLQPGVTPDIRPMQQDAKPTGQLDRQIDEKVKQTLQGVEERSEEEELVELQFEDADLQSFVQEISELFNITFISDEALDPLPKGTPEDPVKALKGNKITFKTNRPLSRKDAWDLFITFLDIAGFAVVPQPDPAIYRIQTIKSAQRAPVPTYLGVNPDTLPANDQMIRYLYFIENASIDAMKAVIPSLQSASAGSPIFLQEHKAFILTDKSYNIKSLMKIVKELDKVTMPQAMSVLKLKQVDAEEVRKLYEELTQTGDSKTPFQPWGSGNRKQPTGIYFPENARIFAEPRTNSLILLGPKDALAKIEDFIVKYIDVDLDQPYSPLFTVQLQYADAKVVADIMNSTTRFGQGTEASKSGGVRDKDKYLRQMSFTPEPATNKIVVRGDYEDFLIAKKIIQELDAPQPQVAIEMLIINLQLIDDKEAGSQIRSKVTDLIPGLAGLTGQNVVFQTSGLRAGQNPQGIVTNPTGPGFQRLLGNLLKLVTQAPAGNTIVTFGQDLFGVWGLFQVLRTITNTQVISNPFLIASNKTKAKVLLGQTRRIVASQTISNTAGTINGFQDDTAALQVDVEPQINSDGMIILNLTVNLQEFTTADPGDGNKTVKLVQTQAIVADKEVLALGGLIRDKIADTQSKTPVLGDMPLLGWLFKNQSKSLDKSSLLILLSAKIIPPHQEDGISDFTKNHIQQYELGLGAGFSNSDKRDPIHKLFFTEKPETDPIQKTIFERHAKSGRRKRKMKRDQEAAEKELQAHEEITLTKNQKAAPAPAMVPIIQQPTFSTIAAPTTVLTQAANHPPMPTHSKLKDKKRSTRPLSNFLAASEIDKQKEVRA